MDIAQSLIRLTVRSFYSVKHTLIIDALIIHSILSTDDFAFLLGSQIKDVRKLLHPLKQARLLSTHSRQESRDGLQKAVTREYYYIPLHPAIDAIKFKVWKLQNKVQELYKPNEERKEWKCPRCSAEWTELEVLDSIGPTGLFVCHRCGGPLDRAETGAGNTNAVAGHEKQARLQNQIDKMITFMRQIDSQDIPENDFESAWERKKAVPRDEGMGARRPMIPVKGVGIAKSGNRGIDQTDVGKLNVNISTGDELNDAERTEAERKKALALEQNQLPVWYRESAIGTSATVKIEGGAGSSDVAIKSERESNGYEGGIAAESMDEAMAAAYAEMAKERQREEERAALAAQDAEEDEDEDEDDDDDFEDVPSTAIGTPNPGATPGSASRSAPVNGIKRERDPDQAFDSGTSTSANTPATMATPNDRESKRAKTDHVSGNGIPNSSPLRRDDPSDSDEDEHDFEDAM